MTPLDRYATSFAPVLPADAPGGRDSGGVLLVGHGTRDSQGQSEFLAVARQVAERLAPLPVEACFLELAAPSLGQGVQRLIDRGARGVVVAPALLFAAGHANHDIPAAVTTACRECEQRSGVKIAWEQAAHLGCHGAIRELSQRREQEALAERLASSSRPLMRLLVGRGSRDARATQEMWEFVAGRQSEGDCGLLDACFVAMAEPLLPEALQRIAGEGFARVLVQPHLLFAGLLTAEIRQSVLHMADRQPKIEWIVAEHLGPDRLVVDALCDRIGQTATGRGWGLPVSPDAEQLSSARQDTGRPSNRKGASIAMQPAIRDGTLPGG